jgi:hypothetical protein
LKDYVGRKSVHPEEEEFYRQSRYRGKRGLAEEMAKFALCFALSEHDRAEGEGRGRRALKGMDVESIKAGILGESIGPGDEVEGEAMACGFTAVYQPRAYYPSYFLGEMRAALRRGEKAPSASGHYLPVSALPPLPDGWGMTFLYPVGKEAFDRPDFPAHARDVLTRDYLRLPLLIPPGQRPSAGRIRFRARLLRLNRGSMDRMAGMGERSYDAYSARGLTFFLRPQDEEDPLRPLDNQKGKAGASLRGSLFAEVSIMEATGWERVIEILEGAVSAAVEEVFPQCERGERQEMECYLPHSGFHAVRFRRRLFALVFDPVIVIYRAPRLLGVYLPCDLMGDVGQSAILFQRFLWLFSAAIVDGLDLSNALAVDIAYDNRLPWAREGGALRGPEFATVEEKHPFLRPTLSWLRGD